MKKNHLLILILLISFNSGFAQKLWNKTSDSKIAEDIKSDRSSMPSKYELYSLDINALKTLLLQAPLDNSGQISNLKLDFPNPDGIEDFYTIYEAPVMEAELSRKFPNIKSYIGKGTLDPTAIIRFSVTLFGLHTMTFSGYRGTAFIDTYTKDLKNYIVYYKSDITTNSGFSCSFDEKLNEKIESNLPQNIERASDGTYRVYRLALACTIEYAAFHVAAAGVTGQSDAIRKSAVLSAMNVSMVRINGLYERDMAVRMNIVANNDLIIFLDSDNFTNSPAMINEIQPIVDAAIGVNNYEIGHGFCTTDSGVAQLRSPCGSGKARGITGQGRPVGDTFDIDYVAHEMGHQFGANHTQNNGCNRNAGTAVEPGSASTIMGYAGICAPNVQPNSDAHFHGVSITEMSSFVAGAGNCSANSANGNAAPVVNAGLDYTIPNGTPFILKGTATDANGDALTYCWEQTNIEVSIQPPSQTSTDGPNFRSNPPIASPDRYMPPLASVIANILNPTWEVVPTVARTMSFALTVRDNKILNGGQTQRDDMVITTAAVGPFLVNAPNTAVSWVADTNQTVTWAVAGTTANSINAAFVDILLSNDGGNTYPIVLASKVPNDGSETITVPNNAGTNKRMMVRGYKHIFYDISNTNFSITAPTSSFSVAFSGVEEQQNKSACQGNNTSYNISYSALGGFTGTTTLSASGLPTGAVASFVPSSINATGNVVMTISNTSSIPIGIYNIIVTGTSGAVTKTAPFYLEVLNNTFAAMVLSAPANNATNQATNLTLNWVANSNANSYDVQVATNNTFTTIISSGTVTTTSYALTMLTTNTDYFWRILPKNSICNNGVYSSIFTFRTGAITCNTIASPNVPVVISASGTPTITSTINITSGGNISDLDVTTNIAHTWVSNLTITLSSPGGITATLLANKCGRNDNINATFDDAGTILACTTTSPTAAGNIIPGSPLSVFNGVSSLGIWTLTITDGFNNEGGSLISWNLKICSDQLPLKVDENTFQNFSLYPNPNIGNFNVKFTTQSSEDISIAIIDMRGRDIFQKSYSNTSTFNQNISLENVQAGMYLVTITEGSKKIVRKIIIE